MPRWPHGEPDDDFDYGLAREPIGRLYNHMLTQLAEWLDAAPNLIERHRRIARSGRLQERQLSRQKLRAIKRQIRLERDFLTRHDSLLPIACDVLEPVLGAGYEQVRTALLAKLEHAARTYARGA